MFCFLNNWRRVVKVFVNLNGLSDLNSLLAICFAKKFVPCGEFEMRNSKKKVANPNLVRIVNVLLVRPLFPYHEAL